MDICDDVLKNVLFPLLDQEEQIALSSTSKRLRKLMTQWIIRTTKMPFLLSWRFNTNDSCTYTQGKAKSIYRLTSTDLKDVPKKIIPISYTDKVTHIYEGKDLVPVIHKKWGDNLGVMVAKQRRQDRVAQKSRVTSLANQAVNAAKFYQELKKQGMTDWFEYITRRSSYNAVKQWVKKFYKRVIRHAKRWPPELAVLSLQQYRFARIYIDVYEDSVMWSPLNYKYTKKTFREYCEKCTPLGAVPPRWPWEYGVPVGNWTSLADPDYATPMLAHLTVEERLRFIENRNTRVHLNSIMNQCKRWKLGANMHDVVKFYNRHYDNWYTLLSQIRESYRGEEDEEAELNMTERAKVFLFILGKKPIEFALKSKKRKRSPVKLADPRLTRK